MMNDRLEIIVGDPNDPKLHTVTTVDCFLETAELLSNPPHRKVDFPLVSPMEVEIESPEILRIRSKYETERDYLRVDYEDQLRLKNIAESQEIEKLRREVS